MQALGATVRRGKAVIAGPAIGRIGEVVLFLPERQLPAGDDVNEGDATLRDSRRGFGRIAGQAEHESAAAEAAIDFGEHRLFDKPEPCLLGFDRLDVLLGRLPVAPLPHAIKRWDIDDFAHVARAAIGAQDLLLVDDRHRIGAATARVCVGSQPLQDVGEGVPDCARAGHARGSATGGSAHVTAVTSGEEREVVAVAAINGPERHHHGIGHIR